MRFWFLYALLTSTLTLAQPAPDAEVSAVRLNVETGHYEDALNRAKERIDRGALTEEDLVELHKYAGLAAFNLGRRDEAERHFGALLKLNPDYNLDPFVVAPPAIAFYEEQRKKLAPTLDMLRERRVERKRAEDEARKRAQEEEERRRVEELAKRTTVRTVEQRSLLVNFVPMGAGQFQQGRTVMGWTLAISEGLLAVASISAYFAYENQVREHEILLETAPGEFTTVTARGIPASRERDANTWRLVKNISGIAFYVIYALGVTDALWHHSDQVVTTHMAGPSTSKATPSGASMHPRVRTASNPLRTLRPLLFPTAGGAGAGVSLDF